MGANVFSRPQTQRDPVRLFSKVRDSQFDSVRRLRTPQNSLTRKRSLVQIQYGPPSSKTCPAVGSQKGSQQPVKLASPTVGMSLNESDDRGCREFGPMQAAPSVARASPSA